MYNIRTEKYLAPPFIYGNKLHGPAILGGGTPVSITVEAESVSALPGPVQGELLYFDNTGKKQVTTFFDSIKVAADPNGASQPVVRFKSLTINAQDLTVRIIVG